MVNRIKTKKKLTKQYSNYNAKVLKIKALYDAGLYLEVLPLVRDALLKNNTSFELINMAGLIELQVGSVDKAIKWLSLLYKHNPKNQDVSENLGNAYCEGGQFYEGQAQYKKLLKLHPGRVQTWCNLGSVLSKMGDTNSARVAYKTALNIDPNFIAALTNLALLEGQTGDQETAISLYYKILLLKPTDGEIYSDLSRFKVFSENDPDIVKMEKLMGSKIITPQDRMFLGYALAKAYEDIGQIDKSFENMSIASKHKRASIRFNIQDVKNYVSEITNIFSSDVFKLPKIQPTEKRPVFIIGMPRSGTTLVEQILASHSLVKGGGELTFMQDVMTGKDTLSVNETKLKVVDVEYPNGVLSLSNKELLDMGKAYIGLVNKRLNVTDVFTDKMPQNFFLLGLIKLILPHAKIIHCKRSPLDTCLSCYSLHFPYGQAYSNELTELGLYYREYDRMMCHWNEVLPGSILNISYEALVTSPKIYTESMLEFCGLPWEENCLEFYKTERQVTTASAAQVRKPIYKTALKRWHRFEMHLQPLIKALGPLADSKNSYNNYF